MTSFVCYCVCEKLTDQWNGMYVRVCMYVCTYICIYMRACVCVFVCIYYEVSIPLWFRWLAGSERHKKTVSCK